MLRPKAVVALALFACVFATTANADQESNLLAPLAGALWRPIQSSVPLPQITMQFGYNSLTISTPCLEDGLSFHESNNALTFDRSFSSDGKPGVACKNPEPSLDEISGIFSKTTTVETVNGSPVLRDKSGQAIVTLEKISPDGIEFRDLKVKSFRHAGSLRQARELSGLPAKFILYDGWMAGSLGCGGIDGSTYEKLAPSKFRFHILSILIGSCDNIDESLKQVSLILHAFDGTLKVAPDGDDFVLRDHRGRTQLVLTPAVP